MWVTVHPGYCAMLLTVRLKLHPTPAQAEALAATMSAANAACDYLSAAAWKAQSFRQFDLHQRCYRAIRTQFGIGAQMAVRCIAKVAHAYRSDRSAFRTFHARGAVAFDSRNVSFNIAALQISIWTVRGRQRIGFACGERDMRRLATQSGESDLVVRSGIWYLYTTCEVACVAPSAACDILGVDLGLTNLAVDSDGDCFSGSAVSKVRYRHRRLRTKLQRRRSRGARRRLKRLSGREHRFATHINHVVSKQLVAKAERTKRALALEDLRHIRTRVRASRSQRVTLHSWAFAQLRRFVAYKARLRGVMVHLVDPRNTSRTCPACGCVDRNNRKTQAYFVCVSCRFAGHADTIAAIMIGRRADVSRPYCSDTPVARA